MGNNNIAWCECGDALEVVQVKDKQGRVISFIYYCVSCDNYYKLVEVKNK